MAETANPSYITVSSAKSILYAVNEIDSHEGKPSGVIQAYKISEDTGALMLLSQIGSNGAAPCFLALDESRGYLFTANFRGGNVVAFRLSASGDIAEMSASIEHRGSGFLAGRQGKPHPHAVELSADRTQLMVADLGLDQIVAYRFDAEKGLISPEASWMAKVHDGAGPRHLAIGRGGRHFYAVNEIDSSITAFSFSSEGRPPEAIQTLSTLPHGFSGHNDAADIRLTQDGRFLYVSNRGADNLQTFAVDAVTGILAPLSACSCGGKTPLSFQISPDERFVMVTNQDSDEITVLGLDAKSGALIHTGISAAVSSPASVAFFPMARSSFSKT
jgi:6-phosphogluconolactonase